MKGTVLSDSIHVLKLDILEEMSLLWDFEANETSLTG